MLRFVLKSLISPITFLLLLSSCASLEERLCNSTKAFQNGYQDVLDGAVGSPGLSKGEACNESKNYSYNSYNRDYMAGFEKAKKEYCKKSTAEKLGIADVAAGKEMGASTTKLQVCLNDENSKVGDLKSFYEIAYRKAFCTNDRAESYGTKDAAGLGGQKHTESDFSICAYQSMALLKAYKNAYSVEIRKQCTAARLSTIAIKHVRAGQKMNIGYALIEKCPAEMQNTANQAYTSAYQSERDQMMREEMLDLEKKRLKQEQETQRKILDLQQQSLDLDKKKKANSY